MTPSQAVVWISLPFLCAAVYHRIRSQQAGESLDRTKEGWFILIGLRLSGLATLVMTTVSLRNPAVVPWAQVALPDWARWSGVACFAVSCVWLIWMFRTLGKNLTDTVVVRRAATLVDSGPYRYVRNPMYTGVLMLGLSLGLAVGTWIPAAGCALVFAFMARRTPIEERFLMERFGDEYRDYMKRTGRFLPSL